MREKRDTHVIKNNNCLHYIALHITYPQTQTITSPLSLTSNKLFKRHTDTVKCKLSITKSLPSPSTAASRQL